MKSYFSTSTLLSLLLAAAPLTAQEKSSESKPAAAASASQLKVGTLTFTGAAPWKLKDAARAMSAGGFSIPGKDGADAVDADFYQFGAGQGGDTEANIKRWQGQFEPGADGSLPAATREEVEIGVRKILMVTLKGSYVSSSFARQKPKAGYAVTGLIIPDEGGTIFLKVLGPDAAVLAAKEQIRALVATGLTAAK